MKIILFSLYYFKLRLGAMLGFRRTFNPLDLKWRWNDWQQRRARQRRQRF
ncbi:MAG TPA: hypothetical protein VGB68_00705 [Pyrinomonadaceae bacterium]|jgi:hypothetical protein